MAHVGEEERLHLAGLLGLGCLLFPLLELLDGLVPFLHSLLGFFAGCHQFTHQFTDDILLLIIHVGWFV